MCCSLKKSSRITGRPQETTHYCMINFSETTISVILNALTRIIANVGKNALSEFDAINFIKSLSELCKCEESLDIMVATSTLIGQILSFIEIDNVPDDLAKEVSFWMSRHLRHEKMDVPTGEQASKNIVCLAKRLDLETYQVLVGFIAAACRFEIKHQVKQSLKVIILK